MRTVHDGVAAPRAKTIRENDAATKRLRARLRAEKRECHLCGDPIDYTAPHDQPTAFQMDHLLQVIHGGPVHDYANVDASHRFCNRQRSDKIDAIALAAAERYGISLTPQPGATSRSCGTPDGYACQPCGGTHNPTPGTTFVTSRKWWNNTNARTGRGRRR